MGQRFGLRSRCSAQLLSLPSIFLLLCTANRSPPSQRKLLLPSLFRNALLDELVTQAKSVCAQCAQLQLGPGLAISPARPNAAQERSGTQPSALTQLPTLRLASIRLLATSCASLIRATDLCSRLRRLQQHIRYHDLKQQLPLELRNPELTKENGIICLFAR